MCMPSLLNNLRLNNQSTTDFKVAVQGADWEDLIVCVCYSQYNYSMWDKSLRPKATYQFPWNWSTIKKLFWKLGVINVHDMNITKMA